MAGLVNKETNKSVNKFIKAIENESKRKDSLVLLDMMQEITGFKPKVWGDNYFIAFGKYTYQRKNSKEEYEWFYVGFAPRKTKLTLYLNYDVSKEETLLQKLGKCKYGKGCLYINKLADIDLKILKNLIEKGNTPHFQ